MPNRGSATPNKACSQSSENSDITVEVARGDRETLLRLNPSRILLGSPEYSYCGGGSSGRSSAYFLMLYHPYCIGRIVNVSRLEESLP